MSLVLLTVLGLSLYLHLISAERVQYENYNIYQVIPRTLPDVQILERLEVSSDSFIFLNSITTVDNSVDILVAPHKQSDFLTALSDNGLNYELVVENFQRTLDLEVSTVTQRADFHDWSGYHTLEENYDLLRSLARKYPNNVKLLVGGSTYEGRQIIGLKVSYKSGNKGIFLEGGIHAREWISPATVTYILNELLTSTDVAVRALAEKYDWYVFPHINPDGYVYTHTGDHLWRKTRSRSSRCYGADPNRNWRYHWMEAGSSSYECSDNYAGKSAFSEIEIKGFSEFLKTLEGKIHTYLSFHSHGQMILIPHGHTKVHVVNHDDLQRIGEAAAAALAQRYGTKYKVGTIYETIYPASGSSVDWVYANMKVPLAFAYELRPSASSIHGSILPASQITPTGEETLDSLVAMIAEAEKLGYYE